MRQGKSGLDFNPQEISPLPADSTRNRALLRHDDLMHESAGAARPSLDYSNLRPAYELRDPATRFLFPCFFAFDFRNSDTSNSTATTPSMLPSDVL